MGLSFNPARLNFARRRRGLSQIALAEAIHVSPRIVTGWEKGEYVPERHLDELVRALRFPEAFFYGEEAIEMLPSASISFRALTSMTARQRDQAQLAGALALRFSKWIDARFTLPAPSIPTYEALDPETAAMAVRAEWGIGELPIRNMTHLLELRGVRVFSLVEDCRALDAYSSWSDGIPYVFLNTMKSAEHSRQDAAHELGHLVLHQKGGPQGTRKAEQEAHRFGSAFLMPKASVLANAPVRGSLRQVIEAKRFWNVSVVNLIHRMHTLELLTDWNYRAMMIEASGLGYRTKEPLPSLHETSQVLAKVLNTLRDDGLTLGDIASELELLPDELRGLVFGLTLTSIDGLASHQQPNADEKQPRLWMI